MVFKIPSPQARRDKNERQIEASPLTEEAPTRFFSGFVARTSDEATNPAQQAFASVRTDLAVRAEIGFERPRQFGIPIVQSCQSAEEEPQNFRFFHELQSLDQIAVLV